MAGQFSGAGDVLLAGACQFGHGVGGFTIKFIHSAPERPDTTHSESLKQDDKKRKAECSNMPFLSSLRTRHTGAPHSAATAAQTVGLHANTDASQYIIPTSHIFAANILPRRDSRQRSTQRHPAARSWCSQSPAPGLRPRHRSLWVPPAARRVRAACSSQGSSL